MWDANARYLPKNMWFMAHVDCIDEKSFLYKQGVRQGDALLCKMRDKTNKNPRIKVRIGNKNFTMRADEDFFETWLIYAGRPCGKGHIRDNEREASLKALGGKWDTTKNCDHLFNKKKENWLC